MEWSGWVVPVMDTGVTMLKMCLFPECPPCSPFIPPRLPFSQVHKQLQLSQVACTLPSSCKHMQLHAKLTKIAHTAQWILKTPVSLIILWAEECENEGWCLPTVFGVFIHKGFVIDATVLYILTPYKRCGSSVKVCIMSIRNGNQQRLQLKYHAMNCHNPLIKRKMRKNLTLILWLYIILCISKCLFTNSENSLGEHAAFTVNVKLLLWLEARLQQEDEDIAWKNN